MKQPEELQRTIQSTLLSEIEARQVESDIQFVGNVSDKGRELGLRVVIHGGYAVDANLGTVTRPHKDIDMQVYGQDEDPLNAIKNLMVGFTNNSIEDKGREMFYHNYLLRRNEGSGVDLYYIHVSTDPFLDEKVIVKADGSLSESHKYETVKVQLNGIEFEAANAVTELVDKMHKRNVRGLAKEVKHDQDIENLQLITNGIEVVKKLKERSEK